MPMILFLIMVAGGFIGGLGAQVAGDKIHDSIHSKDITPVLVCNKDSQDLRCPKNVK